MRRRMILLLLLVGAYLCACSGPIATYKAPKRVYQPGNYDVDVSEENGLLWGEHTQTSTEDNRSQRLGDIVVVQISESANATNSAATSTSSDSTTQAGVSNLLSLVEKWAAARPDVDKGALVAALYKSAYNGSGQTNRNDSLTATIPCQVKKVLPNGDLFIEGVKTIQVNREETNLYLSGVVRPYDIDMSNAVSSQRVLDARIAFSGRGVISDKQGPGFMQRLLDKIWPF